MDGGDKMDKHKRPAVLSGRTHRYKTGCGNIYITFNRRPCDGKIWEVFMKLGKAGGCSSSTNEMVGRILTRLARCPGGPDWSKVMLDLRGNLCHQPEHSNGEVVSSCSDAIGRALGVELDWESTEEFRNMFSGDCLEGEKGDGSDVEKIIEGQGGCSKCPD